MVTSNELHFCRIGVAVLIWAAILLHSIALLWIVAAILGFSAILTVRYAPMIVAYRYTFGLIWPGHSELVDTKAYRFAHCLGFLMACIALGLTFTPIGWGFALFFAVLKSISASGYCPATKLYGCMKAGGCCTFSKKVAELAKK
jgi:hypothetical protein